MKLKYTILAVAIAVLLINCSKKEPDITPGTYNGKVEDGSSSIDFYAYGLPISLTNAKMVVSVPSSTNTTAGNNFAYYMDIINTNTGKILLKSVGFNKNGTTVSSSYQKVKSDYNSFNADFEIRVDGTIDGKTIQLTLKTENLENGGVLEDVYKVNGSK